MVEEGRSPVSKPPHPDTTAVRDFWQRLGLPGLFDVHVHFLPENIQRAVYAVFDSAGPKIGRDWPIRYRLSHEERVEVLRGFGVRRFSTLPYAHKPGVAGYLNDWSRDFAAGVPEVLRSATFYPEPEAPSYVARLVDEGVEVFKVHVQVGEFHLDDPLLDAVWGTLEDAGTPVVIHAGSGPVGNAFTGPDPLRRVLERFPRLCVVVAHMGAPECAEFLAMAETYERVHLDTTMMFTEFFAMPYPAELVPRLRDLQPKVLLGSDFPTIPYPYVEQLEGLARLDLGDDWLRDVCWHNGTRLFGTGNVRASGG
ncbi:amidohydrolase family protein [Nocardioides sp. 503]|uniref:amidohydrolase family protein n=1 Tax=Nocardioides sp. 503 TaxID=2508326 RepID=UPI00106F524E|nr:amidohydrolase family protein [Nocardioides sp. 503]